MLTSDSAAAISGTVAFCDLAFFARLGRFIGLRVKVRTSRFLDFLKSSRRPQPSPNLKKFLSQYHRGPGASSRWYLYQWHFAVKPNLDSLITFWITGHF